MENYLIHSVGERPGHKYLSRIWKNGKWQYTYRLSDKISGKKSNIATDIYNKLFKKKRGISVQEKIARNRVTTKAGGSGKSMARAAADSYRKEKRAYNVGAGAASNAIRNSKTVSIGGSNTGANALTKLNKKSGTHVAVNKVSNKITSGAANQARSNVRLAATAHNKAKTANSDAYKSAHTNAENRNAANRSTAKAKAAEVKRRMDNIIENDKNAAMKSREDRVVRGYAKNNAAGKVSSAKNSIDNRMKKKKKAATVSRVKSMSEMKHLYANR